MITIIKQELDIDESLKTKLSYICEFANTTPTSIKGNIRKLDKTNITYIEPHRIIIKGVNIHRLSRWFFSGAYKAFCSGYT